MIKADMEKAYDCVKLSFLLKVMERFNLSLKWLRRMHQCLLTFYFFILLNGGTFCYFLPSWDRNKAMHFSFSFYYLP